MRSSASPCRCFLRSSSARRFWCWTYTRTICSIAFDICQFRRRSPRRDPIGMRLRAYPMAARLFRRYSQVCGLHRSRAVSRIFEGPAGRFSLQNCGFGRSCGKANATALADRNVHSSKGPPWRVFLPKLGPSLLPVATVILFGSVVTQCINIQITIAITPNDPTTVRATKPRSKKSI